MALSKWILWTVCIGVFIGILISDCEGSSKGWCILCWHCQRWCERHCQRWCERWCEKCRTSTSDFAGDFRDYGLNHLCSGNCTIDNGTCDPPYSFWNAPLSCSNHGAAYLLLGNPNRSLFVTDNFSRTFCIDDFAPISESAMFVQSTSLSNKLAKKKRLRVTSSNGSVQLLLTKWHTKKKLNVFVLTGNNCSAEVIKTNGTCEEPQKYPTKPCSVTCLKTNEVCKDVKYNKDICSRISPQDKGTYYVTSSTSECTNCNNPVKKPELEVQLNVTIPNLHKPPSRPDEPLDPEIADKVMSSMTADFAKQFNESSVGLTMGKSITGVLVKQTDPLDLEEVSFGYANATQGFNILDDRNAVNGWSRSLTVSKEAFEKASSVNNSTPFAAVFRFLNMSKDEFNSTVLADEVIAIEMGAVIKNLTDTVNINFFNLNYKGTPSCNSWKGNGSLPVWTTDGCETVTHDKNITCRCTHMTFFAVLLTPVNDTNININPEDLNTLTIITRVGCGLSMFFLGIVLFMHFVMRRARSSNSTKILIHLLLAMFLLDFAFLINDLVAKAKNVIGCKIMAAAMHYFMLTTFTWFAVHAFHLCLQLYYGGKIEIKHYILKVSITSWVLPSMIGIVLLSVGKYGEVIINTGDATTSAAMCWILDNDVHYIVNIGYYALVFMFTFSTFILMLTWLYRMSSNEKKAGTKGKNGSSYQKIITIMGLCCVLGVTWGCAFFAYGIFRVPAYYCFTILNSFQGFCLFIYYYKTSQMVETKDPYSNSSTSSTTLKTNLDDIFNPYDNCSAKPKPE